mmetsp:Transcript_32058/g.43904  ORF Transcript_32058/g.43904 Transcript_32058/m.43904 type:complete len:228 (+) Transcript_32058:238-921(+)
MGLVVTHKFIINGNVHIARVLRVGSHIDLSFELLTLRNHQNVIQIKYGLFPVSIISIRTSRKPNTFVALRENNVKKSNKSMQIVISHHLKLKLGFKFQVFNFNGMTIDFENVLDIRNHCLGINNINKRLLNCSFLDTTHIKSPHIFPPVDFLVLVVSIFNCTDFQIRFIREHDPIISQPLITSKKNTLKHVLIDQKVTHPLADNNINFVNWQINLFDLALDELNSFI